MLILTKINIQVWKTIPITNNDRPEPAMVTPINIHNLAACVITCMLLCTGGYARAGYLEDIGYTRLAAEQGTALPDGDGVSVTQAEASTAGSGSPPVYLPDVNNSEFAAKTITDVSAASTGTFSAHATSVGQRFYGNASSVAPGIDTIAAYWADDWLQAGYLGFGGNARPLVSPGRIANHSWVGDALDSPANADILRRVDWIVETDEFIQFVGVKNSSSPNSPLLGNAYNVVAVGKSDGVNGYGTSPIDSDYVAGRSRPEIVAPQTTSSAATPVVAASAALLLEFGHKNPLLSTDSSEISTANRYGDTIYNAERSEVIKAVLMAGADRATANTGAADITDYRSSPANRTGNGLDPRFGAGQLNIYNSYHILAAGEQNSDEDDGNGSGNIGAAGFDYAPSFGGARGSRTTASYYFSTGASQSLLTATLAWNIDIDAGKHQIFSGNATLHDLDLFLYDITTGMTLLDSSTSAIDNTETLWITLHPAGNFLLQVVPKPGQGPFEWDYALAWQIADLIDSDGDGIPDIQDPDDDNDGLLDADELLAGTSLVIPDSDGDNVLDSTEVLTGSDPLSSTSKPLWGDIDGDGDVDTADVLLATRATTGAITLDSAQQARGNVAPLVNGIPQSLPDDPINVADLLLIIRKTLGEVSF